MYNQLCRGWAYVPPQVHSLAQAGDAWPRGDRRRQAQRRAARRRVGHAAGPPILLGVTGGIAAYKAVILTRRLVEAGAEVKVMMTRSATEFVGARSFAAVTRELVADDLFSRHTGARTPSRPSMI